MIINLFCMHNDVWGCADIFPRLAPRRLYFLKKDENNDYRGDNFPYISRHFDSREWSSGHSDSLPWTTRAPSLMFGRAHVRVQACPRAHR